MPVNYQSRGSSTISTTSISSGSPITVYWSVIWGVYTLDVYNVHVSLTWPGGSWSGYVDQNSSIIIYPTSSGSVEISLNWTEDGMDNFDNSYTVNKSYTNSYSITVSGGGTTYNPAVNSFTVSSSSIYNGDVVYLNWSCNGDTNGISSNFGYSSTSGSNVAVYPSSNTTTYYTITPYHDSQAGTPVTVSVTATAAPPASPTVTSINYNNAIYVNQTYILSGTGFDQLEPYTTVTYWDGYSYSEYALSFTYINSTTLSVTLPNVSGWIYIHVYGWGIDAGFLYVYVNPAPTYTVSNIALVNAAGNSTSSLGYVTVGTQRTFTCYTNDPAGVTWNAYAKYGETSATGTWSGNIWSVPTQWLWAPTHSFVVRATSISNSSNYAEFDVNVITTYPSISSFYPSQNGVENHYVTSGSTTTLECLFHQGNGTYDQANAAYINNGVGTIYGQSGSNMAIYSSDVTVITPAIYSNTTFRMTVTNAAGDYVYADTTVYVVSTVDAGSVSINRVKGYYNYPITITPSFSAVGNITYDLVKQISGTDIETIASNISSGSNYITNSIVTCQYRVRAKNLAGTSTYSSGGNFTYYPNKNKFLTKHLDANYISATASPSTGDASYNVSTGAIHVAGYGSDSGEPGQETSGYGTLIITGLESVPNRWLYGLLTISYSASTVSRGSAYLTLHKKDINGNYQLVKSVSTDIQAISGSFTELITPAQYNRGIKIEAGAYAYGSYDPGAAGSSVVGDLSATITFKPYLYFNPPNGLKATGL